MPRLDEPTMTARRRKIEDAALRLFRKRGFHGVALRDICLQAKVSIGNVYNHFDSKEAIFRALVERLSREFQGPDQPLARYLARSRFPDDLEDFGRAVEEMVELSEDFLVVILIDVVEFRGLHVGTLYADLASRFRSILGPTFAAQKRKGRLGNVDPAVAFASIYMQFFNYFMVEKLFGVEKHFGLGPAEAVRELAKLFRLGLRPRLRERGNP